MFSDFRQRIVNGDKQPELLFNLVRWLRPATRFRLEAAVLKMDVLLEELEKDLVFRKALMAYFNELFFERRFKITLTETGIIGDGGFMRELRKRISYKILPLQPAEDTLDYLLTNAFYKSWDHKWVSTISQSQWLRLFDLLNLNLFPVWKESSFSFSHLLFSIQVLAQQASATGTSSELLKMVPEYQNLDSPFLALQKELDDLVDEILTTEGAKSPELSAYFDQVQVLIGHCQTLIDNARKNKAKFGISFSVTMRILRLEQQLERLAFMIEFLESKHHPDHRKKQLDFIVRIIYYHAGKNLIMKYINETTHLVAYQATQHTGTTGEKYITSTREEYSNMFWSAAGGGLVIGFLCIFKLILGGMETSLFGHAFWYSINYALGFILIYFLHFTVATKQPAMTAASLAKVLETSGKEDYEGFAALFARLFRSQFVAFCGNVFFSFPTALMIALIANFLFGANLISPASSNKLLHDIDPTQSSAFYHAAIAGFHLFFSGLLSGYMVNKSIHQQVSFRFQRHPVLVSFISKKRLENMALWYDKHLGGLTSNFWLGVLLGCTGTLGYFFGMDWDIRHITFSAGNFALGIVGRGFEISTNEVLIAVFCIGGIGFFNFWVSFLLSTFVAMKARQISVFQLFKISKAIFQRFKHSPGEFFFPPTEPKEV